MDDKATEQFNHVKCKLLNFRRGDYSVYAYEILDAPEHVKDKYILCTLLPNWDLDDHPNGTIGILRYSVTIAGITSWYDFKSFDIIPHRHSANYIMDFIPISNVIEHDEEVNSESLIVN